MLVMPSGENKLEIADEIQLVITSTLPIGGASHMPVFAPCLIRHFYKTLIRQDTYDIRSVL